MILRKLWILLTLICLGLSSYGQVKEIEWNAETKEFSEKLPFDELFRIKISHLDARVNRVIITYRNISDLSYRDLKRSGGTADLDHVFAISKGQTFTLGEWTRSPLSAEPSFSTWYPLLPNKHYLFNVRLETLENLPNLMSKQLQDELIKIPGPFNEFLNEFMQDKINEAETGKSSSNYIDILLARLNTSISEKIKNWDKSVEFQYIEFNDIVPFIKLIEDIYKLAESNQNLCKILNDKSVKDFFKSYDTIKVAIGHINTAYCIAISEDLHDPAKYTALDTVIINQLAIISSKTMTNEEDRTIKKNIEDLCKSMSTYSQSLSIGLDNIYSHFVKNVLLKKVVIVQPMEQTFEGDLVKDASSYFSLDESFGYDFFNSSFISSSGFNIYFRPINKNVPLGLYARRGAGIFLMTRLSLLLGITNTSVQKPNEREGIVGNQGLVVGGGFRILAWLKLTGGINLFQSYGKNPLTKNSLKVDYSPFIGLSIDVNVRQLLGSVGEGIFRK